MSKKKYELNVELKDIPTDDLVKMVRDCWYICSDGTIITWIGDKDVG